MESFVKLQHIKSMQNVYALRKGYNLVERNICRLTNLVVSHDEHKILLIHLLIKKILYPLRQVITLKFDDQVWELENMLKYFKKEIFAEEQWVSLID